MALAATVLAAVYNNADVANTTGYTTASISPAANSLLVVNVTVISATNVGTPVLSGLGLTWTQVATDNDGGRGMSVFQAQCGASPGSGALTLTTSGGDATLTGGQWWIIQVTGHDTTTPIAQFKLAGGDGTTATTSAGTLTNAIGNAGNRVMLFTAIRISSAITPRASWTELAADVTGTGPAMAYHCSWRNDGTNETAFSSTFASARHQSYAIEIAVATAPAPVTGTGAITLANFTSVGTGTVVNPPVTGTGAITLANFTVAGIAVERFTGTSAIALGNFTAAGTGIERFTGSLARTLNNFTVAGVGTVVNPPITGTGAITLANFTVAGTAIERFTGSAAITLANFTSAGTAAERFTGTAAIPLAGFTVSATGTVVSTNTGTAAIALANFTVAGKGATFTTAGMTGWWDADDASTITQITNSVSQWNDKSTKGYHIAQASGSRPRRLIAALNTRNVIQFSYSGSRWLTGSYTNIVSTATLSVFAVMRRDGAQANGRAISLMDGPPAVEDYANVASGIPIYNGTRWPASYRQNAERSIAAVEQGTVNFLIIGSVWDGTNHTMYLNGAAQASVANTGTFSVDLISFGGANTGGNALGVTIAEVIMYDRALTVAERQEVEAYLNAKWFTTAPAITGTGAIQLANFVADGRQGTVGTGAVTMANFAVAASGTVVNPPVTGFPKVWTGSAWAQKPLKVWTGSAWVTKPVKVWTGSEWKVLT